MSLQSLPGHYASKIKIDVCPSCNMFWFDTSESTQLSSDGVVELFQLINSNKGAQTPQISNRLGCVRCNQHLLPKIDRVNTGTFSYFSCGEGHGRLTTFYQFLIEKRFVRTLSKTELERLAIEVKQVKCSGCGAAVNLGTESACAYCRSPIAVFDRDAAKKAIDHYLNERKRQVLLTPPGRQASSNAQASATSTGGERGDLAIDIVWAMAQFVSTSARWRSSASLPGGGSSQGGFSTGGFAQASMPQGDLGAVGDFSAMLSQASLPSVASDPGGLPDLSSLGENLSDISGNAIESLSETEGDLVDLVTDGLGSLIGALFD
jgi:hypothetical protein